MLNYNLVIAYTVDIQINLLESKTFRKPVELFNHQIRIPDHVTGYISFNYGSWRELRKCVTNNII